MPRTKRKSNLEFGESNYEILFGELFVMGKMLMGMHGLEMQGRCGLLSVWSYACLLAKFQDT